MPPEPQPEERTTLRVGDLELSVEESQRILTAVRTGDVDALVVAAHEGERIFTLQGSDDSYRLLIEQMSEGALLLTLEGDILYCNRRFAEFVGKPMEEVWGQNCRAYVDEAQQIVYTALLDRAGSGEGRAEVYLTDTGQRRKPVLMSMRRVDLHGTPLLSAVVTDISERLRLEAALRQSERLAAIGQMVTGLSHESRNALQRSLACVEMLERRCAEFDTQPRALRLIAEIRKAHQDLQRVYEGVQSYAVPIHLDLREVDVAKCWQEAWTDVLKTYAGKRPTLLQTADGTGTRCTVDGFRLRQVFRNLFENSLAACPEPATITVACGPDELWGTPAVCIRVRDNGPGIPPEKGEHIFQPFFTTKTKGTGLGLAIVRRIVEAHGGTIDLGEPEGDGLELVLRLPKMAPSLIESSDE